VGPKTSIAKSCKGLSSIRSRRYGLLHRLFRFRMHIHSVCGRTATPTASPAKSLQQMQPSWFWFLLGERCSLQTPVYWHSESHSFHGTARFGWCDNDPSAGSPTETLLRLHLPLDDKVWRGSRGQIPMKEPSHNPDSSPDHPIGRCDGRCVQRAGT
jgi:hypothetical protein